MENLTKLFENIVEKAFGYEYGYVITISIALSCCIYTLIANQAFISTILR